MTGAIMRHINTMAWMALLVAAPALAAQRKMPADTGRAAKMQKMEAHVKKELGLTDDQAAKLHATHEKFMPQLRAARERGRAIHDALRGQLQPGVAANADSVRKLLDARQANRAAMVQLDRDHDKDLATYLTPVQRARLEMMHGHMTRGGGKHGHGYGHGHGDGDRERGGRGHGWGPGGMGPGAEGHPRP